ncbi:unnamed protein product [Strongylus vulgaris]|uniref:SH3 domain-containing protein n=1 Tax=Strongylus vulgaris TaxID=40348 RepID=A0A3P7INV8_STRVU|nr:unnamed protein product [Strongylus vulgaris]
MEATAEHDFNANADDELSFRRGQILKVLNKDEDPHWFKAEIDGVEGFVPSNYIRMHDSPWYLGKISRLDAEILLKRQGTRDGNFLVRQCESSPGDFSISVKFEDTIQHFKVLRDNNGKYFLWSVKFKSLNELNGLCITYTYNSSARFGFGNEICPGIVRLQSSRGGGIQKDAPCVHFKSLYLVINKDDMNWWEGSLNNKRGVFPANYVCPFNRSPSNT